jgi:hypothetical protein
VLRMHRSDGAVRIFELKQSDWLPHPDGDDLAVAFLSDHMDDTDWEFVNFLPAHKLR